MENKLREMMNENRRVYLYFGAHSIALYTKEMLALDKDYIMFENHYEDIHSLVKHLRTTYLVNYLKNEPKTLLIRNLKKEY